MSAAPASPTPAQRRAADPAASAWVTASAGTGKTRVLADRVLRLLLAGADPQQILCLTFTKAAAAEMVARTQGDLGALALATPAELDERLRRLLGRAPVEDERRRARRLLAEVLDLPAGLAIMTIHAFCQSLLRRFPLEAEVAPHFELVEPREAGALLHEARLEVLGRPPPGVGEAIARLALLTGGDASFEQVLNEICDTNRLKLLRLVERHGGIEGVIAAVWHALGLPVGCTEADVLAEVCVDPAIDLPGLADACRALEAGSLKEQERAQAIRAWLAADVARRIEDYRPYEIALLTKERHPRRLGRALCDAEPQAAACLANEQERLARAVGRLKAVAIALPTAALLRVGWAVIEAYERRKRAQAALDFNDLVHHAGRLLQAPGFAAWVQYKLDQSLEHILVDEGQDTNPEQWAVIAGLCADFFTGEGAHAGRRTLFVVGDEKQSIFSFQGADLQTFQQLQAAFGRRARAARQAWRGEELRLSFRASAPILQLVDQVFASEAARTGVASGPIRHESARAGAPGRVELWPLVVTPEPDQPAGWQLPDRRDAPEWPERRLARAVATRILTWLRDRLPVPSTGEPLRPGDVMILLPRRGILQDQITRELKRNQVPVAGTDRLALIEELAVMDLMALGDAVLLPEDDLTFAGALKSPVLGLDDGELFQLAHGRGATPLYRHLGDLAAEQPHLARIHERFRDLRARADFLPPFEFYGRLLGEGGARQRFLERLGPQALEPIEAFLAEALAYERSHPPSLQGFLQWLRADSSELMRDPDQPRDEVRVLTVHGAKGLEAPVVIVADTTTVPNFQDRVVWREQDGLPLWRGSRSGRDPVTEAAWQSARRRQLEEQRRLLYVALTRARDWLVLAGWEKKKEGPEATWHDLVVAGMERAGAARSNLDLLPDIEGEGWLLEERVPPAVRQPDLFEAASGPAVAPLPAWMREPAPRESSRDLPLHPSELHPGTAPAAASPLGAEREARYRRGLMIHRLLQILPERPPDQRQAAALRHLEHAAPALSAAERANIAREVLAVLAAPAHAALFGAGSRAEVPLAGPVGGRLVTGQVDRLAVGPDEVLVVDYKTNQEPPSAVADVPIGYWRQMAAYRVLLHQIYPGRAVRCALLWTREPRLMALDDALLDAHEAHLMTVT